jgi:hypothetical protein
MDRKKVMNNFASLKKKGSGQQGRAQIIVLAAVFFLMGAAASALWFSFRPKAKVPNQAALSGNNNSNLPLPAAAAVAPLEPGHATVTPGKGLPSPAAGQPDPSALAAIQRSIPNVNSISLEEGTKILRATALAEFLKTTDELKERQKKAEAIFAAGQNKGSSGQQRLAAKQLRDLQAEQVEKLQQIAANARAEIETLQQLKRAAR